MPRLTIDGRDVQVVPGATILDAARQIGIEIPTMCFLAGHPAMTSCLVCVVKVNDSPRLVPACATVATEGMSVQSSSEEVTTARRTALELLLGDHLGDCVGPCQSGCPAHMDIPAMIAHIREQQYGDAIAVIKEYIALPAVLGRICPEICERSCHRAVQDSAVSICLLKRFAADVDLASEQPYMPRLAPSSGKRVAIIGAGPTGLSAAYYLLQQGHLCVLMDEHERPGGMLRYGVTEDRLPHDVLDAEIGLILKLGAELRSGVCINDIASLDAVSNEFDAVLLACGKLDAEHIAKLGLKSTSHGIVADRHTMMTSKPGIFAAGSAVTPSQYAVRAAARGRSAALVIDQYLCGLVIDSDHAPFSVHMGHLLETEISMLMEGASESARIAPTDDGFTEKEALAESNRCMKCECGKLHGCKLRDYSTSLKVNQLKFKGVRQLMSKRLDHPNVIYERGKCISCGLCISVCEASGEATGLAFIGRGFDVRPGVPFNEPLSQALQKVALQCVEACPTGALVMKPKPAISSTKET